MEAFTSTRVSASARRARLQTHPAEADRFVPCSGGYKYYGWESSIVYVKAGGRGYAAGSGKPIHKFDRKPCGCAVPCGHSSQRAAA